MDTTLTSIAHAASYLPDRTRADDVADTLHMHLRTATALIAARLNAQFTSAPRVLLLDTPAGNTPTPGATSPIFTRVEGPSFDLPASGAVSGLVVKYRGGEVMDRDFDWATIEPLVANEDFIYQADTGRLRLLFDTEALIDGLRVEFATGYGVTPEILMGARRADFFSRMGVETTLAPLINMFTGVEQKMGSDCASAPGANPTLSTITIQPPQASGVHALHLVTARDGALVDDQQPLTLTLHGQATQGGPETLLSTVTVPTPLPGQRYTLTGLPAQSFYRYIVRVVGGTSTTVRLSTVAIDYADTERQHMRGNAPEPLSEACAIFAVYLMGRAVNDGAGKESDETRRAYVGGNMPREVAALIAPYRASRVSFI